MLLRSLTFNNHPVLGTMSLDFQDEDGNIFPTVVIAGGNGVGKTVILEALSDCFMGTSSMLATASMDIEILLSESDLTRLCIAAPNLDRTDIDCGDVHLHYDWSNVFGRSGSYKLFYINRLRQKVQIINVFLNQPVWQNVFRMMYNDASVSYIPNELNSIKSSQIDSGNMNMRSSGGLATEVAQLLLDVRSSDSEELNNWVRAHKGQVPPEAVIDKRFKRFEDAFYFMFPHKRFKEISRQGGRLLLSFEQFDKISDIANLSTGEKQIVFRGGFFPKELNYIAEGVALIDEPELSLHPEWQQKILLFYNKILGSSIAQKAQILMATHSPFIVHGASDAQIIILKRDDEGKVQQMPQPTYPGLTGLEAVRAFNLSGFIDSTKSDFIILTEGETDKMIIEAAWKALRPNQMMPFELRAALGMKNISVTLNDSELFSKLNDRRILGLLDFDEAYDQWKGIWKVSTVGEIVQDNAGAGLLKKNKAGKAWAMLLPVPSFRSGFASVSLAGKSILSIEFMFKDEDIPPTMISQRSLALGHSLPYIPQGSKSDLAKLVQSYEPAKFNAFSVLFDTIDIVLTA